MIDIKAKIKWIADRYYLLTGVIFCISLPGTLPVEVSIYPLFTWFFLVPLLLSLQGLELRNVFVRSFLTGLIANGLSYSWIGHFGDNIPGGSMGILLVFIPILSIIFSAKVLVGEWLSRKLPLLRFLIYPSVWILADWIQAHGFLAFPWCYVGYSQYTFTTFIQFASFTGILGINFFIIMFNILIADLIRISFHKDFRTVFKSPPFLKFMAGIVILFFLVLFGYFRINSFHGKGSDSLKVAVVQTCISPWENWELNRFLYLDELEKYTEPALIDKPEFVIWSESATLELMSYRLSRGIPNLFDARVRYFIKNKVKAPLFTGEVGLVLGENILGKGYLPQNSAVLIDGEGNLVGNYAKIHLVPFGEWFPYANWLPWVQELMLKMGGSAFVPGDAPKIFTVKNKNFGALICYEDIFYDLCREYRNLGADFLVNITNDGWSNSTQGHYQHFSASIFRAVENGIPLVRAGNTGVTAIISTLGEVKQSLHIWEKGHLNGWIEFKSFGKTFYSRFGNLIVYFAIAVILFSYFHGRRR